MEVDDLVDAFGLVWFWGISDSFIGITWFEFMVERLWFIGVGGMFVISAYFSAEIKIKFTPNFKYLTIYITNIW